MQRREVLLELVLSYSASNASLWLPVAFGPAAVAPETRNDTISSFLVVWNLQTGTEQTCRPEQGQLASLASQLAHQRLASASSLKHLPDPHRWFDNHHKCSC